MKFEEIKSGVKKKKLDVTRVDNDVYFEAIVKKEALGEIVVLLEGALGKPVWPSKGKLAKEAKDIADRSGGLRTGQTFFFLDAGDVLIFAMLWPWQDGERITVRLGRA
jgi:hypothetical protein